MKKFRKSNKGFTLVELIIVIAIIAILTVVAAPQYIKYVDKARWSKDQNNAASILTAVEAAAIDNNSDEDDDNDIKGVTVTYDATGIHATEDSNEEAALVDAFGDLTKVIVTNTHKYQPDNSSVYTVTVTADGTVTGSWGGATTPDASDPT